MFRKQLISCLFAVLFVLCRIQTSQTQSVADMNQTQLFPACVNGKWGYIDSQGKTIIPYQWEYSGEFRGAGYAMVCVKDEEYGIINSEGEYIVYPVPFIDEGTASVYYGGKDEGIYWLHNGERFAFFDVMSGYLSEYCYHDSQDPWFDGECSELLRITYDGKHYGYVNRHNGKMRIPCVFSQINTTGFHNGFAVEELAVSGKTILVNEQGAWLELPKGIEPVQGALFEEGLLLVEELETGLYGYCNTQGKCVISPQYEDAASFSGGYAAVCQNNLWGHIDTSGVVVCSMRFDQRYSFCNGLAIAMIDGKKVVIEPNGRILKEFDRDTQVFNYLPQGVALFSDGQYTGMIDINGKELIPLSAKLYIDCYQNDQFSEGKQVVMNTSGYWGFIDTSGEIAEECQWDSASNYQNGLARVEKDGYTFMINHEGSMVWSEIEAENCEEYRIQGDW